jgi:DNA polymerase I-like protein with 3'-5' exonuclease and polymerase domains
MKPKNGYKLPPILTCEKCGCKGRQDHICIDDEGNMIQVLYESMAEENGLVKREVTLAEDEKCKCKKKNRETCPVCHGTGIVPAGTVEERWAQPIEFNSNSQKQVIAFMKFMHHPVPKSSKKVKNDGSAADTTEMKELQRLFMKTKHPIYPLLIEKRQLTKMKGTYYEGYAPWADGRIHTTFTIGQTATWQLGSKNPNVQNSPVRGKTPFQKELVSAFSKMLCASPGHMLVNFDYKSFHAQTTACEAGLPDYLRLAKIDLHSFVTCHFIKHPDRYNLLKMPDADLKAFFKAERKSDRIWTNGMTFNEIRNGKAKSAGLGIGFAMGPRKLYQLYREDFANMAEAEGIWRLIICELFPGLGKWQNAIRKKAAEDGFLMSRFGAIRHFYDVTRWDRKAQKWAQGEQAEQAVAFLPASNAFGMIRWGMLKMWEAGIPDRFELINTTHDSLLFDCPIELVEQCKAEVIPIMQAPCPLMVYSGVTGPEGLSVEADCEVGLNKGEMHG